MIWDNFRSNLSRNLEAFPRYSRLRQTALAQLMVQRSSEVIREKVHLPSPCIHLRAGRIFSSANKHICLMSVYSWNVSWKIEDTPA